MRYLCAFGLVFGLCWGASAALADELPPPRVNPAAAGTVPEPPRTSDTPAATGAQRRAGLFDLAAGAQAPTAGYVAADGGRPLRRRRRVLRDPYHPSVPMGETRSAWTAPAVPPTTFALTAGEAMTPRRGRVALNITRISDERFMIDRLGRRWDSDGEVRAISLEVVSPRRILRLGSVRIPLHVSASIHAYTLEHGIFEDLRNGVEEHLLGAGQDILDNHDIGGRGLNIAGQDLLGSTPMWKLRFGVKVPLPVTRIGCLRLFTSISAGLTLPAFGSSTDAGNDDAQPDVTLAYALPFSRAWWFTGALTASAPGSTERFDALGVETEDLLFAWNGNIEYWINPCWAVALGFQYQSNYISGTALAMDGSSTYFNIGILWRPNSHHTIHLVWSENPQGSIAFGSNRDFSGAQRDSDFTFLLGWRYDF